MTRPPARDPALWLLLAIPALLPFSRASEVPLLIAALWGFTLALRGWNDADTPSLRLALVLFALYWLPEFASALDSVAPRKSWTEVLADLRFLGLLLLAIHRLRESLQMRFVTDGIALLLAFWCADALLQATIGWSLGGATGSDRLSGIFGDNNLKLGGVVAVLTPFLLLAAWRRGPHWAWLAALPLLAVVLLAGARAAWISFALVIGVMLWRQLGPRRGALACAGAAAIALAAMLVAQATSSRFAERVDRTAAALSGDPQAIDYALSGRLPIWRTAWAMGVAHPWNGVGVRGFRYAYPDFAAPDDPWVDPLTNSGALHAHQLLLELWSETGSLGLLCWLLGAIFAWRAWRHRDRAKREHDAAPAYALFAMLFPLNTHYAVYSTFWSLLLFSMLALWLCGLQLREKRP